ncbi:MAG: hypothetical protein QRY16_12135 [Enterobacterales bacterium endosymbiont of Blomia tropicalis]|uniref:hypothetical protein n=1 Tax=Mixta mediterraneensis TaxID=2758443 RepID=UPI00187709C5|nr:hypothetical protein [Mixta mediterraneensis]MBE5253823.1 hypothetical protein [Mixta mediterraneensis]MDL4914506.1 hypothetical protein [Mixta mediterraneensis]
MRYRFILAAITAATLLAGCAKHSSEDAPNEFAAGPTQIDVSHIMTRADDGSNVYLTVDGKDAGELLNGESKLIYVPAGKHTVGGYVPTLFGLGRVTIAPVEITTSPESVKKVAYSVTRNKATFAESNGEQG